MATWSDTTSPLAPPPAAPPGDPDRGPGTGIRRRAARGALINAGFLVALNALGLVKGFVAAAFLQPKDFGIWGLLIVSIGTLTLLAQIGVDDKYIQQDHPDQEVAFQIAFTLQAMLCGLFVVLVLVAVPLFALAYGRSDIILPGFASALAMPAVALQTPLWVHYRRLDFARQRTLQAFDPVVGFLATVGLAIAGFGIWALVLGSLLGAWAAAIAAMRASPYPLKLRYERGSVREYASFSWPLLAASASAILITQVPVLVAQRSAGIAVVGAITLAGTMSQYAMRVDEVVTQTIYPAICAAKDRADLLLETFTKSNRIALLWGMPCGVGIALFASDLVRFVIGQRWEFAVTVIQIMGLSAAIDQIGFNWTAFLRARGETRPIAIVSALVTVAVLVVTVPLLLVYGLDGFGVGMGIVTLVSVGIRMVYLGRLFPALDIARHTVRAILPTVPAVLAVLLVRDLAGSSVGVAGFVGEAALFLLVVAAATAVSERALVREVLAYIRRVPAIAPT